MAGIAVLFYQIYFWLHFGNWNAIALGSALGYVKSDSSSSGWELYTGWIGVDHVIGWCMGTSVAIDLILLPIIILLIITFFAGMLGEMIKTGRR